MAKTLGHSQRVLVVSPVFLDHYGRLEDPADLPTFNTVASLDDIFDTGENSPLAKSWTTNAGPARCGQLGRDVGEPDAIDGSVEFQP